MRGNTIYKIANIWKYWNTRKMSSDDAMLAIGKLLPEYVFGQKKQSDKPNESRTSSDSQVQTNP